MKYYCLGIKGAGMSTLACILHDLGNEVIGYDDSKESKFTEEGLNKRNIKINYEPFDLDKNTIVTYSKALKYDHPELVRVRNLGLEVKEYNQLVGELTKQFDTIGVSGTHGKTTTSLIITDIMEHSVGCNYFVGDGTGYASKQNKVFVLEADEFNKHFLAYYPTTAVITNIELDHVECYKDLADLVKTFKKYASKAKNVVACGDDKNTRKIKFKSKVFFYGFENNNDLVAKNVVLGEEGCSFDVYYKNEYFDHYNLKMYGKHMILNSLAAILVSILYNIDKEIIKKSLMNFQGAKRRFKVVVIKNRIIIDDYAHHPTEILATINAAKQKYPGKKVISIFLPNTYSRTYALQNDFIESLKQSDKAYIMDIHSDRESQKDFPHVSSKILLDKIPNSEEISLDTIDKLLSHDDAVYCFMSCTNISTLIEEFKSRLNKM